MATLQEWLAQMENAGVRKDFPALTYGASYSFRWDVPVHPDLGDYSQGQLTMIANVTPGLEAPGLAAFEIVAGDPANLIVPISIQLAQNAQSGLTEPPAPNFVTNLVAAIYYAPNTGGNEVLRAGLLPLAAGV